MSLQREPFVTEKDSRNQNMPKGMSEGLKDAVLAIALIALVAWLATFL